MRLALAQLFDQAAAPGGKRQQLRGPWAGAIARAPLDNLGCGIKT